MAGILSDGAMDALLNYVKNGTENLYICNAQPTTFTEASSTFKLGTKATPTFTGPTAGDATGRKLTIDAITDGSVTVTDTATHYALTDDSNTELLWSQALSAPQDVTNGNTFTLPAIDLENPDPTA